MPDSAPDPFLRSSIRKMVVGAATFALVCVVAVVGYVAAGWSVGDAVYMVVISIFGVGYGEVNPVSTPAARSSAPLVRMMRLVSPPMLASMLRKEASMAAE